MSLTRISPLIQGPLAEVLQAAPIAVSVIEVPSFQYVWANNRYNEILRHPEGCHNVIGKSVFDYIPDPNSDALAALWAAHEKNQSTRFEDWRSISVRSDETYWSGVVLPAYRYEDEKGEIVTGVLGFLVDVTGRVRAEKEARINLERFHEERRKREQFLSLVAHEVRNPLTALKMLSRLAQKAATDEKARNRLIEHLQNIDKQVTLIDRILSEFDSPESGTSFDFAFKNTSVNSLVESIVQSFSASRPEYRFKVLMNKGESGEVNVDPDRLSQVLLNLLVNATHYSPRETTVTVKVSYSSNRVRIEVRDQGVGIEQVNLARIFERSFRVNQNNGPSGLGLGLFVSREVVKHMGGEIWAESAGMGLGSTFVVEFPFAREVVIA